MLQSRWPLNELFNRLCMPQLAFGFVPKMTSNSQNERLIGVLALESCFNGSELMAVANTREPLA